jgi:thioredoxin-like negative regulator of GroEL
MKGLSLLMGIFLLCSDLACHIEHDEIGLFDKLSGRTHGELPRPKAVFEARAETLQDSGVFSIQDMEQFVRLVIKNSHFKPVVLKIYSSGDSDSEKVLSAFQSVADKFENSVIFAGLNSEQNRELFMRIVLFCGLKNVDLPLFMFYKDGQPVMPFLVGYQPQDFLYGYIQRLFFTN